MSTDTDKNISPPTSVNSSLQAKKRVRYVLPQGAVIGGIYEIVKPLGHGGMGEVYLARHTKLDIYRAIKILLPKIAASNPMFATRFMQEARLAIQIQHPNIINVMDANHDERLNIYYIVMELVDGSSIRNLIKKEGPFTEQKTLEIALYVGKALEEADRNHIVHRDIKPDNIMLTKENKVKLADLGIAKSPADSNQSDLTSPEILIGTPAYVSPEQAKNAQEVDCRADIYSLGVSLYEMLAGEKPYKGSTTVEILGQMFNSPVPDVRKKNPSVSRETAQLIQSMMSKEREKRPKNWTSFCENTENILGRTMTIRVSDEIAAETQATAAEFKKEALASHGIVLDDSRTLPESLKPKLKKTMRILIPSVIGFALCMLLMSGLLSGENFRYYKREFILMCMGSDYKIVCNQYHLDPPWEMAFAADAVKTIWINQNKPKPPEKKENIVKPVDLDGDSTPDLPEYKGRGSLSFSLDVLPSVEHYLKGKKYTLTISCKKIGKMNVDLPGKMEVPAGKYKLQMSLPECKEFPLTDIDLKKDELQEIKVAAVPLDGTIRINCNVPQFQIWWSQEWLSSQEVRVDALRNIDVVVKANGYRTYTQTVQLLPNEKRVLNVVLEPFRDTVDGNTENMQQAEAEYQKKNYSTAKKFYLKEAEKGNRIANFRLGEIFENGYGEWFPNKEKAYRYYRAAADQDYGAAIFKVGEFHENGLGNVPKDEAEALKWYRRGAELENVPCLIRIAKYYETGMGKVAVNIENAIAYYKRGAAKRDVDAQFNLGRLYEQKMIAATRQKDKGQFRQMARSWYEEAARQGMLEAKERMRNL